MESEHVADPDPDRTVGMRPGHPLAEPRKVPDRLGPYHVQGELGRGGMGVIHAALDTNLQRRVALKMLPEHVTQDTQALIDLAREARLLASLNHPNIATIHTLEDIDGLHFFTLELVEGETLKTLIERRSLSTAKILHVFKQIADGLAAAHAAGVVHCDLKPANVMVGPREIPKILDFGLARVLDSQPRPVDVARVSGTPGYISPEQIGGRDPDQRSDIFAFGGMLYEALTGHRAFPGRTPDDVLMATVRDPVVSDVIPEQVPVAVRDLTLRCLEKSPDRRLSRIAEAVDILDGAAMSRRWLEADGALADTLRSTLARGDRAVDFELRSGTGELIGLQAMLARGPLLLCFYRGRWCPVCTAELMTFQDHLDEIAASGANVLAISPQLDLHNARLREEQGLGFHLLSDPGNEVAKAWGVAFALPEDLRDFHRSLGLDLKEFNGDDSWVLPIPATFVIGRDGTIVYAATSPDPTTRPDPERAVQALRQLAG